MNLIDILFLAQAAAPGDGAAPQQPALFSLVPLIFVFVIFYFLLIRPQQKRQKAHQNLVNALKTGDEIVTGGGIHGIITNVKDRTVLLKIADNVKIEIDRGAVSTVKPSSDGGDESKS